MRKFPKRGCLVLVQPFYTPVAVGITMSAVFFALHVFLLPYQSQKIIIRCIIIMIKKEQLYKKAGINYDIKNIER
jgi:hypothetical protein